jgi:glycosyltransferase involved in cell wall biosynthesis
MRILLSVHLYPPTHNAGGESLIHNMAKFLITKGHEVHVLLHQGGLYGIDTLYEWEGVTVFPFKENVMPIVDWAEVVITHLGYTAWTCIIGKELSKPVIFISHNTWIYDQMDIYPETKVIYNSEAMKNVLKYKNDSLVLHPPCDFRKYDLKMDPSQNKYITIVNLNKNKGGKIFFNIAKAMPDREFLAVKGGYDPQVLQELPNVKLVENGPDILEVYRKTRVLLMPSKYESWGMCATEAMCSGIPVIYSPTFGLSENVGQAGLIVEDPNPDYEDDDLDRMTDGKICENPGLDPSNWEAWVTAIKRLDNKEFYKRVSNRCKKRSRELDPLPELEKLEKFLFKAIKDNEQVIHQRYLQR